MGRAHSTRRRVRGSDQHQNRKDRDREPAESNNRKLHDIPPQGV